MQKAKKRKKKKEREGKKKREREKGEATACVLDVLRPRPQGGRGLKWPGSFAARPLCLPLPPPLRKWYA